jgi:phospholipase/carboxylesterase
VRVSRRCFLRAGTTALGLAAGTRRSWADDLTPGTYPLQLDRSRDGLLYVPAGYRSPAPAPLIVMFHGAGGSGQSCDYAFAQADRHGALVLAPDSRDEKTWDIILGEFGPDGEFLQGAFQAVRRRVNVDMSRLAIGGHSDGASYALSFGIGVGDEFPRIVAMSPGVMTPFARRGTPAVFVSHGISDPVMPIDDTSRKFVARLRTLGYDVTYREYDGGHGVPQEIVADAFSWLGARWVLR